MGGKEEDKIGLELAKCYVTARGDTSQVPRDLQAGQGQIQSAAQGLASTINRALALIGIGVGLGALISQSKQFIALAERQIHAETRMAAVVKGTGMAAGFTAEQLKKQASALQAVTMVGDEEILELQAKLLTFKSVTNDTFERAVEVTLNLAAVMGTNASGAALQLGRALEDPIRGITALRRSGVSFSEEQKNIIKQYVQSNQLVKAQTLILDVVQGQLGDVAREMAKTDAGKLQQARNVLGDMREELGKKLIPVAIEFTKLQMKIADFMQPLAGMVKQLGNFVKESGGFAQMIFKWGGALLAFKVGMIAAALATRAYTAATQGAAIATVFLQAIAGGPVAWAKLATGIAFATAAVVGINLALADTSKAAEHAANSAKKMGKEIKESVNEAKESVDQLMLALSKEFSPGTFLKVFQRARMPLEERLKDLLKERARWGAEILRAQGTMGDPFGAEKLRFAQAQRDAIVAQINPLQDLVKVFGGFGRASELLEDYRGQLEKLRSPAEKLKELEDRLNALFFAGKLTAEEAGKLRRAFIEDSPMGKASEEVEKMQRRIEQLRSGMTETQMKIKEFYEREDITPEMTDKLAETFRELDLREFGERMTESLRTPVEKVQEEFTRFKESFIEGIISPETYQRGLEKMQKELMGTEMKISGRFGIADFGKRIQDAILQQESPQVKATKEGTEVQKRIEKELQGLNANVKELNVGGLA